MNRGESKIKLKDYTGAIEDYYKIFKYISLENNWLENSIRKHITSKLIPNYNTMQGFGNTEILGNVRLLKLDPFSEQFNTNFILNKKVKSSVYLLFELQESNFTSVIDNTKKFKLLGSEKFNKEGELIEIEYNSGSLLKEGPQGLEIGPSQLLKTQFTYKKFNIKDYAKIEINKSQILKSRNQEIYKRVINPINKSTSKWEKLMRVFVNSNSITYDPWPWYDFTSDQILLQSLEIAHNIEYGLSNDEFNGNSITLRWYSEEKTNKIKKIYFETADFTRETEFTYNNQLLVKINSSLYYGEDNYSQIETKIKYDNSSRILEEFKQGENQTLITKYFYNSDGKVSSEEVTDKLTNTTFTIKYYYDEFGNWNSVYYYYCGLMLKAIKRINKYFPNEKELLSANVGFYKSKFVLFQIIKVSDVKLNSSNIEYYICEFISPEKFIYKRIIYLRNFSLVDHVFYSFRIAEFDNIKFLVFEHETLLSAYYLNLRK